MTIPHKEAAFAAVARRDEAAEKIGAVNTLWFEDGVLCGGNTDAARLCRQSRRACAGLGEDGAAVVLGAGGAARAVIQALKERGFTDIRVTNRTVARAVELADRFGEGVSAHLRARRTELLGDAGLLVNTTALGMAGKAGDATSCRRSGRCCPATRSSPTSSMCRWRRRCWRPPERRGLKTVDGLGMLLHQAVPGFERWFGRRPDVTRELRAMIVADMEA